MIRPFCGCRRAPILDYRCRECGAVFKRLSQYGLVENALRLLCDPDASAWICEGRSDGAPDRQDGSGIPVGAEAAPLHSGRCIQAVAFRRQYSRESGPGFPAGRRRMNYRIQRSKPTRCITQKFLRVRGKKGSRIEIRVTLPALGPTKPEDGALTRTTGLRSWGWSAAKPGGPASESVLTRRKKPFGGQLLEKRRRRPVFLPTNTARICGSKTRRNPGPEKPLTTLKAGPPAKMVTVSERFTFARPEGIWTGLRNRLRRFRGVHKDRLSRHVAMFELASGRDQVTPALLQRMCGV